MLDKNLKSPFAENLKKLRKFQGLSVEKLAQLTDCPTSTIWGYEAGKRTPSIDFPIKLNKALGVDINWLLTGQGQMFVSQPSASDVFVKIIKLQKGHLYKFEYED